jgi:competence protein ComEC
VNAEQSLAHQDMDRLDLDELLTLADPSVTDLPPEPGWLASALLAQGRRLVGWIPVAVALGAVTYFALSAECGWPVPAAIAITALIAAWLGWGRLFPRLIALGVLCLSVGFLDAWLAAHRAVPMPMLPTRAVVVNATVGAVVPTQARDGTGPGRRVRLENAVFETGVDIGMRPLRRTLLVRLRDDDTTAVAPGMQVRMRALLRPPSPPSWPGGRDPQRDAWFSGAAGSGYALSSVSVIANAHGAFLRDAVERVRERVAHRIGTVLPGQSGAIAQTLLAGEQGAIAPQTRAVFAASGLAHLLAVAGLHLGLVMGFVLVAIRSGLAASEYAALRWPCREIAAIGAWIAGAGYVVLTGAHLPALRSLGMAAFVLLALLTGRRVMSMRALALVALALLLASPENVLDVSFQMSFAAVMALIAGYEALRRPLERLRGEGEWWRVALGYVAALGLTSLLAGAATLPVSLAHFGLLQPWFVLANLIAVPLAAIWVMPLGLCALALMPFGLDGPALHLMAAGIGLIVSMARGVAGFSLAQIPVPAMPSWALLLYMVALCGLCLWHGRARLLALVPIVLALSAPFLVQKPDLFVAPDAGLIAVRQEGRLAIGGPGGLDLSAARDWLQATALPEAPLPEACDAQVCRIALDGQEVVLRARDRTDGALSPPAALCSGAALFVSVSPARGACQGGVVIDRFSVWRDGAYAAWMTKRGVTILSDRTWRGVRPWVPPPGGRGTPNLPLAQAE